MPESRHTGRLYHGEAVYHDRAVFNLDRAVATPVHRRAVERTAAEMLAVERDFARRKGTRRAEPNDTSPPVRHLNAVASGLQLRLLCCAAIDLATAWRGCHAGSVRHEREAA
jgi:hypothetical protein